MKNIKVDFNVLKEKKIIKRLEEELDQLDTWLDKLEEFIDNIFSEKRKKNLLNNFEKQFIISLEAMEKKGFEIRLKRVIEICNQQKILEDLIKKIQ